MRAARLPGAVGICLIFAGSVSAAPAAQEYVVTASEVEVRSGPSKQYYATDRLQKGQTVAVLKEENGWLAIKPPPGSFSWVNDRLIEQNGPYVYVKAPDTPLRVGSRIYGDPPSVQQVKVQPGTQLYVIGKKEVSPTDGTWLPVLPAAQEIRYLPADAARPVTVAAAASPPPAVPPAVPTPAVNARWLQALQVEATGNLNEAIRLYSELSRDVSATDPRLAQECAGRARWLRDGTRDLVAQAPTAPNTNIWGRTVPAPPDFTGQPPPGKSTSQYTYAKDSTTPAAARLTSLQPAATNPPNPVPPSNPVSPSSGTPQWSGAGRLYRAAFAIENHVAYAFEPGTAGQTRIYVTAYPGLNLEPYVHYGVNLYGSMAYDARLRAYHLVATHVTRLP